MSSYKFKFRHATPRDLHENFNLFEPDRPLANYMFGQNANSRLMNRLLQKEGWSYGTGSGLTART